MRTIWILALLTACGTGDADDKSTVDTDTDVVGDTDDTDEGDTDVDAAGKITGTITDGDGNELDNTKVRIQFCRGTACITPDSTDGGEYVFTRLKEGPGSFEIVPIGDDGLATAFSPIQLGEDEELTIDAVVPTLDAAVAIPSARGEIEVIDGVYLTLGDGDLKATSPLDPAPTVVSAVDATDIALPVVGLEGELVAMIYMDPFDYPTTEEGTPPERILMPVRFDNDVWALADNEAELWVGDYFDAEWEKVGDLTVDGDGKLATTGGLPRISTLVVMRKPVD